MSFRGAVLALVDPLPASAKQWPEIWTEDVSGWETCRSTISYLHKRSRTRGRAPLSVASGQLMRVLARAAARLLTGRDESHVATRRESVRPPPRMLRDQRHTGAGARPAREPRLGGRESGAPGAARSEARVTGRPLFQEYIAVDYSGAKSATAQQKAIWLAILDAHGELRVSRNGFTRNTIRSQVVKRLCQATRVGRRVIFAFDHQYAWPPRLRDVAGVADMEWREAFCALHRGQEIPPSHPPKFFCKAANDAANTRVFFSRSTAIWSSSAGLQRVRR